MIKKSDLKVGDIVICKDSYYKYVLLSTGYGVRLLGNSGWMNFDAYKENLTLKDSDYSEFNIVKVYRPKKVIKNQYDFSTVKLYTPIKFLMRNCTNITDGIYPKNFINFSDYVK